MSSVSKMNKVVAALEKRRDENIQSDPVEALARWRIEASKNIRRRASVWSRQRKAIKAGK